MTRTKNWYRDFRIEDLTWGINTRDYPSEIEDKQALNVSNWNFQWNKLVSWPWIGRKYNTLLESTVRGFTVDWEDIWHIQEWNLYKNWSIEHYNNDYTLTIADPENEMFSMWIDWNNFTFKIWNFWWNPTSAYSELETKLRDFIDTIDTDYNLVNNLDGTFRLYKDDWWEISITNPSLVKQLELDSWDSISKTTVTVDWLSVVLSWYASPSDALDFLVWELPIDTYRTIVTWATLKICRIDATPMTLTSVEADTYTYSMSWYSSEPFKTPSQIYWWEDIFWLYGSWAATVYYSEVNIDGVNYRYDTPVAINNATVGYTITYSDASTYAWSNKRVAFAKVLDLIYQSLWVSYNKSGFSISSYDELNDSAYFEFSRTDYAQVTITRNTRYVRDDSPDVFEDFAPWLISHATGWSFITEDLFSSVETNHRPTVTITTYNEISKTSSNTWIEIEEDDMNTLTISSLWILISSFRGLNSVFIDNDWVATSINAGWGTISTIYNWKTIIWWYEWKDTIRFSKTEDPVSVDNELLDFSAYSAWSQSVSWGNKWKVTWFIVWENWLYAFKENEVWYSNTEKDTWTSFNFIFNKITSNWAYTQNAICEVEQEIFYFDYKNRAVRRLSYEKNLTTLRDVSVSSEVEDIFKAIPDDDEWNDERFSTLINLSYRYPYLEVNYPDENAPYIYISGVDENFKFRVPNKTMVYNTYNKSWAKRTDKEYENKYSIMSHKWYYGSDNWDIYNSIFWDTLEDWILSSKEYVFIDDVDYKRIGELEVVWTIRWIWWTKNLEIQVLWDWELLEIWEEDNPYKRIISAEDWETVRIREKIDLFDEWQYFTFNLLHNWDWEVEIADVNIRVKPLKTSQYYY